MRKLHEEKVGIARRIRELRARPHGCLIRRYSDGRDIAVSGYQGGMFCVWCPDQDRIPPCDASCIDGKYTCHHVDSCPCSIPYSKPRLAAFMRWLTRHVRNQITDRQVFMRRLTAIRLEETGGGGL